MFLRTDRLPIGRQTLMGSTVGPAIATGMISVGSNGAAAPVFLGKPEALDVCRLAREIGWCDDETSILLRRVRELEQELVDRDERLVRLRDLVTVETASV